MSKSMFNLCFLMVCIPTFDASRVTYLFRLPQLISPQRVPGATTTRCIPRCSMVLVYLPTFDLFEVKTFHTWSIWDIYIYIVLLWTYSLLVTYHSFSIQGFFVWNIMVYNPINRVLQLGNRQLFFVFDIRITVAIIVLNLRFVIFFCMSQWEICQK